jgi:small subunit ribosomal protein S7
MARRKAAPRREILADPLFHSELLAEFINILTKHGKKSLAESIVYGSLDHVIKALQKDKNLFADISKKTSEDEGDSFGDDAPGSALKLCSGDIRQDPEARELAMNLFKRALKAASPSVEVRSRRVGGSTYQVPVEVRPRRRKALGMRWLASFARKRSEKSMTLRLANEILDALADRGGAVRQRQDVHRMAKSNQAFAHFRW